MKWKRGGNGEEFDDESKKAKEEGSRVEHCECFERQTNARATLGVVNDEAEGSGRAWMATEQGPRTAMNSATTSSDPSEPSSAEQSGGGLYLSKLAIVTVTGCRCEGCSITDSGISNFGGGMVIALPAIRNATVSDLSFEGCTSASNGGGICLQDAERTHIITSLSFKECYATNSDEKGNGGGMALSGRYGAPHNVTVSHLKFEDCSADRL
ncbi:hypothetical protein BLNAU_14045 [Blattamonas nauphoetae]|uniref:Uncharacterized protein n=1 Tax=Blattamonas nauphoetae TaxID=2049346 RepID=A0ABQ9XK33_9EUKA|nr:hypothetical protein BLNAU_14045 [Blattamonas nauphoetae]